MSYKLITRYTIFKTVWGYFGLAGTENALFRTHLPLDDREIVKSHLLKNIDTAEFDKQLFKPAQEQITAYFEGSCVNFSLNIPVMLDGFSNFTGEVLTACRDIKFGDTISYGRLAKRINRADASRAIGGALAKNPLPLIIPCHRVIHSDGKVGGFSAVGGIKFKKKLLLHEQHCLK